MSDNVGGPANPLPSPVTDPSLLQGVPLTGNKNGLPVSSVPPNPQLHQLQSPASGKPLDQRTAAVQKGVIPTPGLKKEPEEVDDKSYQELQDIEDNFLKQSGSLLQKTEELRVTDLALSALQGQEIDYRHQLKVSIQMPGEPPPPLELVPMNKDVAKRDDLKKLMEIAQAVLQDHKEDNFKNFHPEQTQGRIKMLQDVLKQNAEKMGKKDPSKPSKWEQKFESLQQKQAHIEAKDSHGRTAAILAAGLPDQPEHPRVKVTSNPDFKPVPQEDGRKKSALKRSVPPSGNQENLVPNAKRVRFNDDNSPKVDD